MSDTVYVSTLPDCNFCAERNITRPALYDGRTHQMVWANMCAAHFNAFGIGLGTGIGQRLVVGEKPEVSNKEKRAAIRAAVEAGDFDEAEDLIGDGDPFEWL